MKPLQLACILSQCIVTTLAYLPPPNPPSPPPENSSGPDSGSGNEGSGSGGSGNEGSGPANTTSNGTPAYSPPHSPPPHDGSGTDTVSGNADSGSGDTPGNEAGSGSHDVGGAKDKNNGFPGMALGAGVVGIAALAAIVVWSMGWPNTNVASDATTVSTYGAAIRGKTFPMLPSRVPRFEV